jgi:DNA-binding MarR family transcriptional regulator
VATTTVLLEVWRVSRRARAALDEAMAGAPLDPAEFGLYSVLAWRAPLTPTALAALAGSPVTTTSEALRRMEVRGHLTRKPVAGDRRSHEVELTEAGRETHRHAGGAFVPVLRAVEARLGDDLATVLWALVRLDRALGGAVVDVPDGPAEGPHVLRYSGDELTPAEAEEAVAFVSWLRHRRGIPAG